MSRILSTTTKILEFVCQNTQNILLQNITNNVTQELNKQLTKPLSKNEIKEAGL